MKTPRPCYVCGSDKLSLLFPNRWHDFAVVCLGCGEFGASLPSADDAIATWDARCESELRERSRDHVPDDRKALPSEIDRSQLRCTPEEAELLRAQLARIGMAKP